MRPQARVVGPSADFFRALIRLVSTRISYAIPIVLGVVLVAFGAIHPSVAAGGAPVDGHVLRIALVSDPHTNRNNADPDQGRYKGHMKKVIADVNATGVDLVLIAGDLTQGGLPEQMDDFSAQIKGFTAPVRVVPGNHDVGDKLFAADKPGAGVTSARVQRYEKHFGPSWWSENFGGYRIIGVNTSIMGADIPEEQFQWDFLQKELSTADAPPTLLVMHYPPFTKTEDERGGGYWNLEPAPRAKFLALLRKPEGHVIGLLTGHLHRWNEARLQMAGDRTVPIITTPPVSFGIPRGKQPEGWTLIVVNPAQKPEVRSDFRAVTDGSAPPKPAAPPAVVMKGQQQ